LRHPSVRATAVSRAGLGCRDAGIRYRSSCIGYSSSGADEEESPENSRLG